MTLSEGLAAVSQEKEPRRNGRQTAAIGPAPDDIDFTDAPIPVEDTPALDAPDVISEAQRTLLWATATTGDVAEQELRAVVAEVTGQQSTKLIPRGSFDKVLAGIEASGAGSGR